MHIGFVCYGEQRDLLIFFNFVLEPAPGAAWQVSSFMKRSSTHSKLQPGAGQVNYRVVAEYMVLSHLNMDGPAK